MVSPAIAQGTRLGPYEVLDIVGRGGMGEVYRARDPRLGREVAVKVLPAEVAHDSRRLARFEREARAVAALNHPNVLTVYDVGNVDGIAYLVTELLQGQTLREWLLTGPLPTHQALGWALEIVRGLEAAHARGLVHRDLKPSNVFVTADGRVKILDFGLAQSYPRSGATGPSTSTTTDASPAGMVAGTLAYMSPEQLRGTTLDARSDLFSLGVVLYEMLGGASPFGRESAADVVSAILSDPAPLLSERTPAATGPLERIVERCLEKRAEDRFASAHDLGLALEALAERPSAAALSQHPAEPSPYPGLASFTERDAADFFGREREVATLWEKLQTRPLLAVIGPSGAGKTSFVRAGVVASCPPSWAAAVCTPGRAPLRALAQALVPEFAGDPETLRRLVAVEKPEDLLDLVAGWRRRHDAALLVADQFEELFTLNPVQTQTEIATLLGRLATEADVHVLLVLRDDFLIRTQEQPAFEPVLQDLTALLPVSGDGLRRAVVEPARKHGYRFADDALVEDLVAVVEGERGALPLLAFAMARLWEERDRERRLLTRTAHETIGGVEGALARHAEATLERIGLERQGLVREIFRNLVTAQGTRAVTDREELLSAFPDRDAAEEVLKHLVDARLLTSYELESGDDQPAHHRVEIVHESLLRSWPRLVRWQAQDADGALLRDQLKQAAHLWEEKGRTADVLWSGTAYREFSLWRERYPGTLTELEQDYARAMVERAQRRKRLGQGAVAAAFVVLVGVASAIAISREQTAVARDEARAEALRAEASKVLVLAQSRLADDPTEALALATASLELVDSEGARVASLKALAEAPPATEVPLTAPDLYIPAFSPDGRHLAIAGNTDVVHVFPSDGADPLVLHGRTASPNAPNRPRWASPEILMAGLTNGVAPDIAIWALPDGKELRRIAFSGPTWWHLGREMVLGETRVPNPVLDRDVYELRAWSLNDETVRSLGQVDWQGLEASTSWLTPNARGWMYSRGSSVYLRSLPVATDAEDRVVHTHRGDAFILAWDPESRFSFGTKDDIRQWVFDEGKPTLAGVIPRPEGAPTVLRPDHAGHWLAGRPRQANGVQLWSTSSPSGARPVRLRRSGSWYMSSFDFHPDDRWLVATTHGGERATFWPLREPQPSVVEGYATLRRPVAFSPDGCRLATSWADRVIRLWTLPGCGPEGIETLSGLPTALWTELVFDPGGRRLLAVANAGVVFIVPLDGGEPRRLEGFPSDALLESGSVSPSGKWGAAAWSFGGGDRTLRVWNLATGESRVFDLPDPKRDQQAAPSDSKAVPASARGISTVFFRDDSTLVTGGDGGVRRWNLIDGTAELLYTTGPGVNAAMAADREAVHAVVLPRFQTEYSRCQPAHLVDLRRRTSRVLTEFGDCVHVIAIDRAGAVVATGDASGVVRVGKPGQPPHLLLGHEGVVGGVLHGLAISPDLRWVASAGEDNTLRLWPMPDLGAQPLHTLPREELIAKLKSLTNLRAVRDPEAPDGWRIDLAPFPGWQEVPTW